MIESDQKNEIVKRHPGKHGKFTKCWFEVWPSGTDGGHTLNQYCVYVL